jgi:hypothetical protein
LWIGYLRRTYLRWPRFSEGPVAWRLFVGGARNWVVSPYC